MRRERKVNPTIRKSRIVQNKSTHQTKGYLEYQKDSQVYIFIPNPNPIDYNKALIKELLK